MCLTNRSGILRAGTTLVELTVVLVLVGLIVGGLLSVMDRQQRFYRETSVVAASRSQVRQAAGVLLPDLRGLSPAGGDILEALDSALELRSTIASGVLCEAGQDWIALAPERPPDEPALAAELVAPETGDDVRILLADEENPAADRWHASTIAEIARDPDACIGGPFIDATRDAGRERPRLGLTAQVPPDIRPGAPVRITRPVRYSLYRSADRQWYLGVKERRGGNWSGIQPVSGPYSAPGSSTAGLRFEYQDASGAALRTSELSRLARISFTVRTTASAALGSAAESAAVIVALRNRQR